MEKKVAWWDKLAKPQYGGEMVIRLNRKIVNLDPYNGVHLTQIHTAWMEKLFVDDWTLNPEIYNYIPNQRPNEYVKGHLAETWEFKDPTTFVVHLRKGIHWQDIPRQMAVNLSPMMLLFTFTACTVSAAATLNQSGPGRCRRL